jgi:hypothetical protein
MVAAPSPSWVELGKNGSPVIVAEAVEVFPEFQLTSKYAIT